MIWEFYRTEEKHGKKAKNLDVVFQGKNRQLIFCNAPKYQRISHCQKCGIKIPREVPRIKLEASYYYGSGYYCMGCGLQLLKEKRNELENCNAKIAHEILNIEELEKIADEVMADEWYPKKMALAKMFQVMEENHEEQ